MLSSRKAQIEAMFRKLGLIIVTILVLVIVYNLISRIIDAVKSGERLSQSAQQLDKLETENKELKKRLEEVKSQIFIEEQARNKLGFSKKGETVVIIPDEKIKQILGASQSSQLRLPNWQGWLKLFFPQI